MAVDGHLLSARISAREHERDWAQPFKHGSMRCVYFAPKEQDNQTPHTQDELYVVIAGHGALMRGEESVEFSTGDALFVPAGMEHRFVNFSEDFECWAVFWGLAGGEPKVLG